MLQEPQHISLVSGGGHASVVYELLLLQNNFVVDGYYDDDTKICEKHPHLPIPYLGQIAALNQSQHFNLICCIGNNQIRKAVVEKIERIAISQLKKVNWISVIHPNAFISSTVSVGIGTVVFAGAVIQSRSTIGDHVIINTSSSVDHDCKIGDFVHIAPGAHLCGQVSIGDETLVSVGTSILPQVCIKNNCTIGADSTVLGDVAANSTVFGVVKKRNVDSENNNAINNEIKTNTEIAVGNEMKSEMKSATNSEMKPVAWIAQKPIDWKQVQSRLAESEKLNHYTNYGPCVKYLEEQVRTLCNVEPSKAVVVVNNGSSALHALVSAINQIEQRALRYAVQAFTFPTSVQGSLQTSVIVDIDIAQGALDLNQVNPTEVDGIVITNILGNVCDLRLYEEWAQKHHKILLLDNAATASTIYKGRNSINCGNGSIISFHHTKPIGFGEGGAIIIDRKYELELRKIINFGYDVVKGDMKWLSEGNNFKMSDVAAAFISCYFSQLPQLITHHQYLYGCLQKLFEREQFAAKNIHLFPNFSETTPFVACFVVCFPLPVLLANIPSEFTNKINIRKYYKPLSEKCLVSIELYNRILCFPCHSDVSVKHLESIIDCIKQVCKFKQNM